MNASQNVCKRAKRCLTDRAEETTCTDHPIWPPPPSDSSTPNYFCLVSPSPAVLYIHNIAQIHVYLHPCECQYNIRSCLTSPLFFFFFLKQNRLNEYITSQYSNLNWICIDRSNDSTGFIFLRINWNWISSGEGVRRQNSIGMIVY